MSRECTAGRANPIQKPRSHLNLLEIRAVSTGREHYNCSTSYLVLRTRTCGRPWFNAPLIPLSGRTVQRQQRWERNGPDAQRDNSRILSSAPQPPRASEHPGAVPKFFTKLWGCRAEPRRAEPRPNTGQIRLFQALSPALSVPDAFPRPECQRGQPLIGMASPLGLSTQYEVPPTAPAVDFSPCTRTPPRAGTPQPPRTPPLSTVLR